MEATSNSTSTELNFMIPVIRLTESNIKINIEKLKDKVKGKNLFEIMLLCDRINGKVLICKDDPHLTTIQNCSRRVSIASELLLSVCSLYEGVVDYEYRKTVNDLLDIQYFRTISRKLRRTKMLELKETKFFTDEAVNIVKRYSKDNLSVFNESGTAGSHEKANKVKKQNENSVSEILQEEPKKSLEDDWKATQFENATKIRDNLDVTYYPMLYNTQPDFMPDVDFERTFVDPVFENQSNFKIHSGFLNNSLGENAQPEVPPPENVVNETKLSSTSSGLNGNISETSSRQKLPSLDLEEVTPKKKPRIVIKDKNTVIHNYSKRALELNKNINICRIPVYDVPPFIKKAFSVSYLMSAPAFKNSLNQSRKNGILGVKDLYKRHLKTEHKLSEVVIFQSRIEAESVWRKKNETFLEKPWSEDIIEERRLGKKSEYSKLKDVLFETPRQSNFIEPTLLQSHDNGFVQMSFPEPISDRPPIIEQQKSTKQLAEQQEPKQLPPLRKMWREFKFVEKTLEKYWSLMETEKGHKSIAVHELLNLENELTVMNYLTLIRVLDKMSLQRKIYLKCDENGVIVAPFHIPFLTQQQYSLKQNQLLF